MAGPEQVRQPGTTRGRLREAFGERGIALTAASLIGRPWRDDTLAALAQGYAWLPDRRRAERGTTQHHDGHRRPRDQDERCPVRIRLLGQRSVALVGPDAAAFFADDDHIRRHDALPGAVRNTLFGQGPVHTLDGAAHRHRKALFLDVLRPEAVDDLVRRCGAAWDEAARGWAGRDQVVLFDASAEVITRAVTDWTGLCLASDEIPSLAADLVALVDGFATLGPRRWRARGARRRLERRFAQVIGDVRTSIEHGGDASGSPLVRIATHRDADGALLDERTAAVELLNVLRPTVAVSWFVAFMGHALARWPEHRARLASGDEAFARAFAHELRRFYPFAPFIGGRAVREASCDGVRIPADALVLLDLYGHNHLAGLWQDPYRFDPERFLHRPIGPFDLIPQGAGDVRAGHRCPGEGLTVALLTDLAIRLARLDHVVPEGQDLSISLRRIPARPGSGVVIQVAPADAT